MSVSAFPYGGNKPAGGSSPLVQMFNFSGEHENDSNNSYHARFRNDGELEATEEGSIDYQYDYLDSGGVPLAGLGDDFEVRCTVITGDDPNGTLVKDTWYAITSNRQFSRSESPSVDKSGTWDFEVREIADPTGNTDTSTCSWSLAVGD